MDNDLAWLPSGLGLKPHTQPAVRFIALFEAARRDGIGEDKECLLGSKFSIQPFDQKIVFMIEHFLEPHAADVAVGRSVNGVAKCHIIGGHGLGDRAGCTANAEESARYLLSRANFSESAILRRIQIDVESLLVGPDLHLRIHTISLAAIDGACKSSMSGRVVGRLYQTPLIRSASDRRLAQTPYRTCYSRTCSAFFV